MGVHQAGKGAMTEVDRRGVRADCTDEGIIGGLAEKTIGHCVSLLAIVLVAKIG